MIEKIKSIVLFILVINSLLLSGMLIFYSPDSVNTSLSEYLPRITVGQDLDMTEVLKPSEIIYHFGDKTNTISRADSPSYQEIINEMQHWTFYDFSPTKDVDWQDFVKNKEGFEILYPGSLSQQILSTMFRLFTTDIQVNQINRIWIVKEQEYNIKAYFISDEQDKVVVSQTSISNSKLGEYLTQASEQPKYDYYISAPVKEKQNILKMYYLPDKNITMKRLENSFTSVSVSDYIQLLFIDPSVVKKVEMNNNMYHLYTDGNRSLQYYPNIGYITYFQPTSETNKTYDLEKDFYAALRFVNQHGGWDGSYYLKEMNKMNNSNQSRLKFQKFVNGYPLFEENEGQYGIIEIQLTDGIVSELQRSSVIEDKREDEQKVLIMTNKRLNEVLKSININEKNVKNIELGYRYKTTYNSIILEPSWNIELANGKLFHIPAYERVVADSGME